jgi:NTP pyrophosphatase (non-canonical NTP hydrolase)
MDFDLVKKTILKFRDDRDRKQFHNPKNLAEAISIEAGELLELFLWKNKEDIEAKINNDPNFKKEIQDYIRR